MWSKLSIKSKFVIGLLFLGVAISSCSMIGNRHHQVLVTDEQAAKALDYAKTKLGARYVFGARGPDEFDSSGIITWSYRQVIPSLKLVVHGRVQDDAAHRHIYAWNFEPLPLEEIKPGDLVYITDGSAEVTHGAMFIRWIEPYERMEFLDASSRLGYVAIQEWPVNEVVRGQTLVAVGRLKVAVD